MSGSTVYLPLTVMRTVISAGGATNLGATVPAPAEALVYSHRTCNGTPYHPSALLETKDLRERRLPAW